MHFCEQSISLHTKGFFSISKNKRLFLYSRLLFTKNILNSFPLLLFEKKNSLVEKKRHIVERFWIALGIIMRNICKLRYIKIWNEMCGYFRFFLIKHSKEIKWKIIIMSVFNCFSVPWNHINIPLMSQNWWMWFWYNVLCFMLKMMDTGLPILAQGYTKIFCCFTAYERNVL